MDELPSQPPPSLPQRPLMPALARVLLYLLVYLFVQFVVQLAAVAGLAAVEEPPSGDATSFASWLFDHPGFMAAMNWVALAAALAVTAFFVLVLDRRPWNSLGFSLRPAAAAQVAVGFALGGALMAAVFVAGWLLGWFRVTAAQPADAALTVIAIYIAILVPAAALEEIGLRGYVLQTLEASYGWRWALAVSAVIFGFLHGMNPNAGWGALLGISFSGVYLGAAYLLTRRLWLPIAVHTAWNLFEGPVFGFAVSGLQLPATILHTEVRGPALWTGGVFGPEAGLLLALVLLAQFPVLRWATRPFRTADGLGPPSPGTDPAPPAAEGERPPVV